MGFGIHQAHTRGLVALSPLAVLSSDENRLLQVSGTSQTTGAESSQSKEALDAAGGEKDSVELFVKPRDQDSEFLCKQPRA